MNALNFLADFVDRVFSPAARARDEKLAAEIDELRAQASHKIQVIDGLYTVLTSPEVDRPQDVAKEIDQHCDELNTTLKDLTAKLLQFAEVMRG